MILADLKRYLMQHQQATLADIALHLDADADAVRGMLAHWIQKGKVEKCLIHSACGVSCHQCDPATVEIYRWKSTADGSVAAAQLQDRGPECHE
jgi:hypothetical protein